MKMERTIIRAYSSLFYAAMRQCYRPSNVAHIRCLPGSRVVPYSPSPSLPDCRLVEAYSSADQSGSLEGELEPARLDFFRNLLTERLEKLLMEAESGVGELVSEKENLPDSIDLATHESNRDFTLRMRDRERKLIYKIRKALVMIDEGDYGECEVCGEDISEGRLMARPVTTHCIDCKTEAEQQERVRGL